MCSKIGPLGVLTAVSCGNPLVQMAEIWVKMSIAELRLDATMRTLILRGKGGEKAL